MLKTPQKLTAAPNNHPSTIIPDFPQVKLVTDIDEYLALAIEAGKIKTTPEMLEIGDRLEASETVFIVFTVANELAATIGIRSWEAEGHFSRFLQDLYTPLYAPDSEAIDVSSMPPVFNEIRGRVCYAGEFFIASKWRRKVNISDISLFAYSEARERWDPDWFFGYVTEKHGQMGLSIRYHGARSYKEGVTWKIENPFHRSSDRFVCSNRADIEWAFKTESEESSVYRDSFRVSHDQQAALCRPHG